MVPVLTWEPEAGPPAVSPVCREPWEFATGELLCDQGARNRGTVRPPDVCGEVVWPAEGTVSVLARLRLHRQQTHSSETVMPAKTTTMATRMRRIGGELVEPFSGVYNRRMPT